MKIAFISDIHGSAYYCEQVLQAATEWGADKIAVLGDVMYHGPRNPFPKGYDPQRVAELLNSHKNKIIAVRGNCDSEVDQMLIEYPMMGDYAVMELERRTIFLTHGHIYNPDNHPDLPDGSVLAFGHIHTVLAEKKDNFYCFNPSSISLPKEQGVHTWGRYYDDTLEVADIQGNVIKQIKL